MHICIPIHSHCLFIEYFTNSLAQSFILFLFPLPSLEESFSTTGSETVSPLFCSASHHCDLFAVTQIQAMGFHVEVGREIEKIFIEVRVGKGSISRR
jgi:hypothetical protein